jgi:hypothetical protein
MMYPPAIRRSVGDAIQISKAPHHGEMPLYPSSRAAPHRNALSPDNTSEPASFV